MRALLFKQNDGSFMPAYDSDHEKMKKCKPFDLIECEVRKPRNPMFHRKFWALLNMVYDNQETYQNIEDLRFDLTIVTGFYERREDLEGDMIKKPKSISFSSMDEEEFSRFYDSFINTITKYFDFNKEDMLENIEQFY